MTNRWVRVCGGLALALAVGLGGCKGGFSLGMPGGGDGKSASKPSASSAGDESGGDSGGESGGESGGDSGGDSGGRPSTTAVPQPGKMVAGKAPPWCAGYEASSSDSNLHWIESYQEKEGLSWKTMEYMAKAACDKPSDGERQKLAQTWKAAVKSEYAATDDDFVLVMTYVMGDYSAREKLKDEQCKGYEEILKDEEASAEQRSRTRAEAFVVGCVDSMDDDDLYWLDVANPTMVQRLAMIRACIKGDPKDSTFLNFEYGFCGKDMKALDRAKLDKEAAKLELNLHGRVLLALNFGEQKARASVLMKKYGDMAKKDETWQTLFEAHDAGWDGWIKLHKDNEAVFKAIRAFDDKANKGSKKAVAGCGAELRRLFLDRLKKAKVKVKEDAVAVATDAVGYPLLLAMMRCDAMEERYLATSTAQNLFFQGGRTTREHRGPRHAAYYATMDALNKAREDRENFKLEKMIYLPGVGYEVMNKAYEKTFNKVDYGNAQGLIDKVKPGKDGVAVTFKTVKWKEPTYKCKRTNRISRIREDGSLEYEENCKVTGYEKRSSTESPVTVAKDFAAGLKSGQMVVMTLDSKGGKRHAIPTEVYANADKKKFLGFFGVVW